MKLGAVRCALIGLAATCVAVPCANCGAPAACTEPTSPIEYGTCAVVQAETAAHTSAPFAVVLASDPSGAAAITASGVTLDPRPESYAIVIANGATTVVGRDQVGAMYGALDLVERLTMNGAGALPIASPVTAAPAVALRAANLFLTLPADGESSWWFRDRSFWVQYLDMMARARLDFLDVHAMYNLDNTVFPNALLWFATSKSFPSVGIAQADRATNVAMLNTVIAMAAVRGIKVGVMSYTTGTSPLGDGIGPTLSDTDLATYTREAAADLATRAPELWRLGFRVGESGRAASWYAGTFVAGVKSAGTGVETYTRTWGVANKADLLSLIAAAGPDTIVEAKYNGEQLAAPYAIAGAGMATWGGYSYQSFLDPPTPYPFVFQVRSGGTHRIFRYASYERTRRTALSLAMSPRVTGFTLEAAHAYLPQRDFYHVNPADSFSPWAFRRDELAYLLFGRLAYDPTTDARIFRAALAERASTDALWDAVQAASDIVPWIQTALTCGPDQPNYAPELELGGTVADWATSTAGLQQSWCAAHVAFDGFAVAMPYEAAQDLVTGRGTSRLSPVDVALRVLADAVAARAAASVAIDTSNPEARDVVRECIALADLGEWFAHKLRAATALAVYAGTASSDWLAAARSEAAVADAAFTALASDTSYIAPFDERMRMSGLGLSPFHWSQEVPLLAADASSIDGVQSQVEASPPTFTGTLPAATTWLVTPRAQGPGLVGLHVTPMDPSAPSWSIAVELAGPPPAGAQVNVLYKAFPSDAADWASVPATGSGVSWNANVPGAGTGGMFAVEIVGGLGVGWRYPDVTSETPYRVLAP